MSAELGTIQSELPLPGADFTSSPREEVAGEYWRWCPRCGHELENDHCKLHCPRCHYFMSCSDFD
jgi:Zn finger protein HypA/HybF involved in hydrogenase expression